jgi:hypothetical protein
MPRWAVTESTPVRGGRHTDSWDTVADELVDIHRRLAEFADNIEAMADELRAEALALKRQRRPRRSRRDLF